MATEETKAKRHHSGPLDEGSPITVGGGGGIDKKKDKDKDKDKDILGFNVEVTFQDGDYPEEGHPDHGRRKFRHKANGKIRAFSIRRGGEWRDFSHLLPQNGNCSIVIGCEGENDDVIINGNKLGIDMNTDTYVNLGGGTHRNPNAASFINSVVLNANGQLHNLGPFSEDDECMVCTDLVPPDESECPSA